MGEFPLQLPKKHKPKLINMRTMKKKIMTKITNFTLIIMKMMITIMKMIMKTMNSEIIDLI